MSPERCKRVSHRQPNHRHIATHKKRCKCGSMARAVSHFDGLDIRVQALPRELYNEILDLVPVPIPPRLKLPEPRPPSHASATSTATPARSSLDAATEPNLPHLRLARYPSPHALRQDVPHATFVCNEVIHLDNNVHSFISADAGRLITSSSR
ncbi:hypothetical protein DOTSEDRAFT_37558 [Dothistroma septosporum NZE10]|uniref:Uncharacterized protein n=1 Tax=Dothistroma septosporum (strain NZE10 / CBS 128990) TaxID=675120 RepID=N1PDX0_DOTSN|nr:hypothetical protein DOTSEDRAFT_37558 [Dothistroma septosporum NZE10]